MASIADLLGVQWGEPDQGGRFVLNSHAARQATAKGFDHAAVLRAANDPGHTSDNGRYEGQRRHVRDGIVAVVDPARGHVVTVYEDQKETAPRTDQKDHDAQTYRRRFNQRSGGR